MPIQLLGFPFTLSDMLHRTNLSPAGGGPVLPQGPQGFGNPATPVAKCTHPSETNCTMNEWPANKWALL